VPLPDFSLQAPIGMFRAAPVLALARNRSIRAGVLDGSSLGAVFSCLRPNDLVWNYWVNNYLMGNDPPRFDILAWNADPTDLPASLHRQFLDIFARNVLARPRELEVLGTPVDLGNLTCETYVTGALTDHLMPWKACYRTTQMLSVPKHLGAEQRRAHREPGQPGRQPEGPLPRRAGPGRGPRRVAVQRGPSPGDMVGPLGGVDQRCGPRGSSAAGTHEAGQSPAPRAGACPGDPASVAESASKVLAEPDPETIRDANLTPIRPPRRRRLDRFARPCQQQATLLATSLRTAPVVGCNPKGYVASGPLTVPLSGSGRHVSWSMPAVRADVTSKRRPQPLVAIPSAEAATLVRRVDRSVR
jgi:hypothetical protein